MTKTKHDYFIETLKLNDACLAPLAGVTDLPFRLICLENDAGIMVSEMISAKGLFYGNKATENLLELGEGERNTGVQIFGSEPEVMSEAVKRYLNESRFAFIDINMGCPVRKVVSNGEGSALLAEPDKLFAVANAVVKASDKPVSAKIRIGFGGKINCAENARLLEDAGVDAVAVHGRTREQMYSGKADWDRIAETVEVVSIPVLGNGDVASPEEYARMKEHTNCAGVMIGRGAMGNPFIFKEIAEYNRTGVYTKVQNIEKLDTALRHFEYLMKYKGEPKACVEMRNHLAWYTRGMPNSAKMRNDINGVKTRDDVIELIDKIKNQVG